MLKGEIMERLDLYRCEICGNLVEIILSGGGELVCCGQAMQKLDAKNAEEAMLENHIPVFVKRDDTGNEVRVGEVLHPMNDDHYIMFIETISEDKNHVQLQYLHPGEEPKMLLQQKLGKTLAREFCNLHGLWEGESD